MAKVITLSRTFPSYHHRAGQPTYFIEKVFNSLDVAYRGYNGIWLVNLEPLVTEEKHHTIRDGKRWKDGDMASLRVWSGRPYHTSQLTVVPELEVRVKDVKIANGVMWVDGKKVGWDTVAENDGLTMEELRWWFPKPVFDGQMLIWNNKNLPY